jgi:hypothetical protein
MSEIMLVPLPRLFLLVMSARIVQYTHAASRRFISFLTFQISIFFSASLPCCGALIVTSNNRMYLTDCA